MSCLGNHYSFINAEHFLYCSQARKLSTLVEYILQFSNLKIMVQPAYLEGKEISETLLMFKMPLFHYQGPPCYFSSPSRRTVTPNEVRTRLKNSTLDYLASSREPATGKASETNSLKLVNISQPPSQYLFQNFIKVYLDKQNLFKS